MHLIMTIIYTWEERPDDSSKVNWRTEPSARCSPFIMKCEMECNSVLTLKFMGRSKQSTSLISIIPYVSVFEIGSHCVCHHA